MTLTSHFPNGFANGVEIQGIPILNSYAGNVYWVDSATGSDGYKGTRKRPFATLNKAVESCTANKGDIIFLMPNHYEDIADTSSTGAIDLDVAGISVIGLGNGSNMPRFDFNHADSDFLIGANDILIQNINFEATVTEVKMAIGIEAGVTGTTIRGNKFSVETTSTDEFLTVINILAGCDNTLIESNVINMGFGGALRGIRLEGASADIRIYNNTIKGDFFHANIGGITTASTEVDVRNNLLMNGGSGNINTEPVIGFVNGTTGYVIENHFFCNVATIAAMTVADTMFFSRNYASEDVGAAAGAVLRTGATSVTASADD